MARPEHPASSDQPDPRVLATLAAIEWIALLIVWTVAGVTLCAWFVPALGHLLPAGWTMMKPASAFLGLMAGLSVLLCQSGRPVSAVRASRILAALVILLAAVVVVEQLGRLSLPTDLLFATRDTSFHPNRISVQVAWTYLLLGIVLLNVRARKSLLAYLVDAVTISLCLLILTFFSVYAFGISGLFGSTNYLLSPQTFLCLLLLTFLVFNRRAESSIFSVLLGGAIGSRTARVAAPCAALMPFVLSTLKGLIVKLHLMPESYALAVSASLLSLLAFCLVVVLSRRINTLEASVRELSLRDELTKLYNRRGFYVLAEQSLRLAQRAHSPFFVLFIDLDDLKRTNDTLGHEIGSNLLRQVASLIEKTFRETDVLGRLGGDEFVVTGGLNTESLTVAIQRLEQATAAINNARIHPYIISYSLGYVFSEGDRETLDQLLKRADMIMYESKRRKKRLRNEIAPA